MRVFLVRARSGTDLSRVIYVRIARESRPFDCALVAQLKSAGRQRWRLYRRRNTTDATQSVSASIVDFTAQCKCLGGALTSDSVAYRSVKITN